VYGNTATEYTQVEPLRLVVLKFGTVVHYGFAAPASWLKPITTGRMGGLKWRCSANGHSFSYLCKAYAFIIVDVTPRTVLTSHAGSICSSV